ncbi:MAG: hypothetical protein WC494_01685 [Candidatus Pacearchaeota archaeon]
MKNNPFKMFGSYVGFLIGFLPAYFSFAIIFALAEEGRFHPIALTIPLGVLILSFLIGWRIHSLFRKLKRHKKN